MIKILFAFAMLFAMFSTADCSCHDALKEEVMFEAFNNGYKIEITNDDVNKIDELFMTALKGSYPMPALGVSLHDETIKAVENGVWLRFAFKEPITIDGLNFDQLLIELTKDMYGFNIIRGNDGVFDGRNFYINLKRNLDEVYDYVKVLPVSQEKFEAKFVYPDTQQTTETEQENNVETAVVEELEIREVCCDQDCLEKESCQESEICDDCKNETCEECKEGACDDCFNSSDCDNTCDNNCDNACENTCDDECEDCEKANNDTLAESMPAGKGNKNKPGVIRIDEAKKKDKDVEHMIQYSSIENAIIEALKF